jgi:hypothetical protein
MPVFEIRNLEIFCKLNLDQSVIIYDYNLDCKVLTVLTQKLNLTQVQSFKK